MVHSQQLARPARKERVTASTSEVHIILMEPARHGHKDKTIVWTANKIVLLVVLVMLAGGVLWYWGGKLYAQYQTENAALQLEKQAIMAKKAQEQERYRAAWQEQRDTALRLHQLRQKEAEDAHTAWQNYYKTQELQAARKR